MEKKISVIIPTFNRAHTILDALRSVAVQTYSHWECLIIDDGSTDNSEEVIMDFIASDDRFKLLRRPENKTKGAASCRNIGLENMTGDYVQYLDSDDYISENKFEDQLKILLKSDSSAIRTCRYGIQKSSWNTPRVFFGKRIFKNFENPSDLFRQFALHSSYFPLNVYLVPSNVIRMAGPWAENLNVNDDGEYFSRIILNSSKIVFSSEAYAVYRTGAGNRLTGELKTQKGIDSYVRSWNLIEENILNTRGIKNHLYVRWARRDLHKRLMKENPDLINLYQDFLKRRWSYLPYQFTSLLNKVRTRLFLSYSQEETPH